MKGVWRMSVLTFLVLSRVWFVLDRADSAACLIVLEVDILVEEGIP